MKIAVIGCGYVGLAFAETAVRAGHDVVGTTTTPSRMADLRSCGVMPVMLDVASTDDVRTALADREIVYLCIAAGRQGRSYRDVYLAGVERVLEAAGDTRIRQIIYTSSTSVYAQDDGQWVDEASPTQPRTDNARTLLQTEQVILGGAATLGIQATALRLTGIYGPGREPARWAERYAGTRRADGEAYLNLVHLNDIVTALGSLIDVPHHGVLNLNDDQPIPRRAFYDSILTARNLPPIRWVAGEGSPKLGKRVRNDLVKRTLGFTLKHPTH